MFYSLKILLLLSQLFQRKTILHMYVFFINKVFVKVPEEVLRLTETVVELKKLSVFI